MMLRAANLHKSYGRRTVLRGVTVTVSMGDRVGLVGANGTGKSTLLRLLAGEPLDAGCVEIADGLRVGLVSQTLLEGQGTVWDAAMAGVAEFLALRARLQELAQALSRSADDRTLAEYASVQEALEHADGFNLEPRVRRVLAGLGLPEALWKERVETLSGGEQTRLNLARVLVAAPDVLLLDEPTNHLDVAAIEWLETFVVGFRGAIIAASHDRRFLNAIATRILQLEDGMIREYRGNYDAYRSASLRELAAQAEAYNRYREEVARLRDFARRQLVRAAQIEAGPKAGRDHRGRIAKKVAKRAHAAQSRVKRLEVEAPEQRRPPDRLSIRLDTPGRLGPTVAHIHGLSKQYGNRVLFADFNLTLRRGDRVGLVGPNGAGKTTLLRILAGCEQPTAGEIVLGPSVRIGILSQQPTVAPDGRRVLDVALDLGLAQPDARALLAALLFRGDRVFERIRDLSGGERTRISLLDLLAHESNLLLLDEPTNHLDLPARERLEEALEAYTGTLVVASHDRFLVDRLCTTIWTIGSQRVTAFDGNYAALRSVRGPNPPAR